MNIESLLKNHKLKKTSVRVEVLNFFLTTSHALSAKEIITHLGASFDRVTVYRTLHTFEDKGIVHKASEDVRGMKYALCKHKCADEKHRDQHVHLICDKCHQTYCLEDFAIPKLKELEKYRTNTISYVIDGICENCLD